MISNTELGMLVNQLVLQLKSSFWAKHITMNLANTIEVIATEDGYKVRIPAVAYDLNEWNKHGVLKYTPEYGSYAEKVDETGGFSKTHTNFVEKAIGDTFGNFFKEKNIKVDIEER